MRVNCLAQEHNTVSPARVQTRTARSGDERTNHEATAPPTELRIGQDQCLGVMRFRGKSSSASSRLGLSPVPDSPFFAPPIGAEPGRAKRESRITCMRMLRTNQSKITRVHTTLLASMCRAMPFSAQKFLKGKSDAYK